MYNQEYWSPEKVVSSGKFPFTMGQLRGLLLNRHKNGLSEAVRKIGKRVYLRVDLLYQWMDSQKELDL